MVEQRRLAGVELGVFRAKGIGVAHALSSPAGATGVPFGIGGAEPPAPATRERRGGGFGRLSLARGLDRGGGGRSLGSGQGSPIGVPSIADQSSLASPPLPSDILPSGAVGVGSSGCSRMIRSLSAF